LVVDVFSGEESVTHLRQRVPSIDRAEASKIAAAVGFLPLAVATAGAWLAETNYTVADYLEELERQPHRVLSASELPGQVPISRVGCVAKPARGVLARRRTVVRAMLGDGVPGLASPDLHG
jgi:hypothetical protein